MLYSEIINPQLRIYILKHSFTIFTYSLGTFVVISVPFSRFKTCLNLDIKSYEFKHFYLMSICYGFINLKYDYFLIILLY